MGVMVTSLEGARKNVLLRKSNLQDTQLHLAHVTDDVASDCIFKPVKLVDVPTQLLFAAKNFEKKKTKLETKKIIKLGVDFLFGC